MDHHRFLIMWKTFVLRIFIIGATTILGALWLKIKGPVPVIRIMTPLPEMAPTWYMLSAFPVLGMLIADAVRLFTVDRRRCIELSIQILVLVLISNGRIILRLPISGHALVFAYFLFRRHLFGPTRYWFYQMEMAASWIGLAAIVYLKLVWWTDPVTLLCGAALALGLAGFTCRLKKAV